GAKDQKPADDQHETQLDRHREMGRRSNKEIFIAHHVRDSGRELRKDHTITRAPESRSDGHGWGKMAHFPRSRAEKLYRGNRVGGNNESPAHTPVRVVQSSSASAHGATMTASHFFVAPGWERARLEYAGSQNGESTQTVAAHWAGHAAPGRW